MISIVIPVFNEATNIPILAERIRQCSNAWGELWEVIWVDDGSTDESYALMTSGSAAFKAVKLSRNFGHQAAISAGLNYAQGEAVIVMDADLQDPPEVIVLLLTQWRAGYDVVYAIRQNRPESWWKKWAYHTFYRLLQASSEFPIPVDSGDFSLMDRKVVDVINQFPEKMRFMRGLRAYAGFKQTGVLYSRGDRESGETKYSLGKLIRLALDGLFDFSSFPLRLASVLGFFIAIPSFLIGIFFILHRFVDFKLFGYSPKDIPGMATLTTGLFFLGGIMLIMLGVLGEYLAKIYHEVKQRPPYIVEKFTDQAKK